MTICRTSDQIRAELNSATTPVAFVPTMGALHEGHLSLVKIARDWGGKKARVVVSIYVNPTQFAPNEDFTAYPRKTDADLEKCRAAGVDLVFAPEDSLYREDASTQIVENSLSENLCGKSRPHFFGGVCTVVAKLFNIVQPDAAVFGEKDFQQLSIVRRMVRDLDFPIEILSGPIVRESDGLAMSSRNQYLTKRERNQARVLSESLEMARQYVEAGERDPDAVDSVVRSRIQTARSARIDYVQIVDPENLQEVVRIGDQVLVAVAVFFGKTRLIDNVCLRGLA